MRGDFQKIPVTQCGQSKCLYIPEYIWKKQEKEIRFYPRLFTNCVFRVWKIRCRMSPENAGFITSGFRYCGKVDRIVN